MKHILLLICACSTFSFQLFAQDETEVQTTTYYLIRHAEKEQLDRSNKNPALSDEGEARAKKWAKIFQDIEFGEIYSTNYIRTVRTVTPTAEAKQLELKFYDPRQMDYQSFFQKTKGKTVLIVGHSNTTPSFVNAILGTQKYANLEHDEFGKLFIVTVMGEQTSDQVLTIE